jgi:hypothetical protein
MPRKSALVFVMFLTLVLAQTLTLGAQEKDKNFTGSFQFGYRSVDTDENAPGYNKYREHINLTSGMRLFNLSLSYRANEALQKLFDQIDLSVMNLGGDPFESFSLGIRKFGIYKFRFDRRKSDYYYADMQMTGPGAFYDSRRLDYTRTHDSGEFNATLASGLNVYVNFDRYTKQGLNTTAYEANRVAYSLEQPVSEKMTDTGVGLDWRLKRYSFGIEQRYQKYSSANTTYLPAFTDTGAGTSVLNSFLQSLPYDFKTSVSTFRFTARPFDTLIIKGSARISSQKTTISYTEEASGVDIYSAGYQYQLAGQGDFTRKMALYDLDLSYLISDKLAVVGAFRYDKFTQTGSFLASGTTALQDFGFNTRGIEAGLQYEFDPKFVLTLGYRNEARKLTNLETAAWQDQTTRNGLFGNLKWDLRNLHLTADYQRGRYENPFTLISPTRFDRFRATARWQLNAFNLSASYRLTRIKSDVPGGLNFLINYGDDNYNDLWKSSNDQINLRLGYHGAAINFSLGYAYIHVTQDSTRLISYPASWAGAPGTFNWVIAYTGNSTLLDADAAWTMSAGWKLGLYANNYKNTGFWPVDRTMLRAYVEYLISGGFAAQLAYRYARFKESLSGGANNYNANIFEFTFGYRWD